MMFIKLKRIISITKEVSNEKGLIFILLFGIKGYYNFFYNHIYCYYVRLWSMVTKKPIYHVIGDSHSWAFRKNLPFIVHNIGPATAYNVNNKNSTISSYKKLFEVIKTIDIKRDYIILVFGEIDCRIHIYNQYKKNNESISLEQLMDRTISNYGDVMDQLNMMGVKFYIYCIPPATPYYIRYPPYATTAMKTNIDENLKIKYPYLVPIDLRVQINMKFNNRLKNYCLSKGYSYIDIYDKVSDLNGYMLLEYADDEIHLNTRIVPLVKDCLKNLDAKHNM